MDWRQCFAEYKAALTSHQRAQSCADELQSRLATCTADCERSALP